MANEFVVQNGLLALDTSAISGSLTVSGSVSASAFSGALSGLATTASGLTGGTANYIPLWTSTTQQSSSNIFQTGNNIGIGTTSPNTLLSVNGNTNITGSLEVTGQLIGTASLAATASYALNAGAGSGFPFSGSAVITGSLQVIESGITGSLLGTSSLATSASFLIGFPEYSASVQQQIDTFSNVSKLILMGF